MFSLLKLVEMLLFVLNIDCKLEKCQKLYLLNINVKGITCEMLERKIFLIILYEMVIMFHMIQAFSFDIDINVCTLYNTMMPIKGILRIMIASEDKFNFKCNTYH